MNDFKTWLRSKIIDDSITVEVKPPCRIPDGMNLIFLTGDPDPLHISSDDRRFMAMERPAR